MDTESVGLSEANGTFAYIESQEEVYFPIGEILQKVFLTRK